MEKSAGHARKPTVISFTLSILPIAFVVVHTISVLISHHLSSLVYPLFCRNDSLSLSVGLDILTVYYYHTNQSSQGH